MIKLIILDDKGSPIFNPEVKMFAPFKRIIERDRGKLSESYKESKFYIEGDHDGRYKKVAAIELAFVYWYCDPRSQYRQNFPDDKKARFEKIKTVLGLPDIWKIDDEMQIAINFYEEETLNDFDLQLIDSAIRVVRKVKDFWDNISISSKSFDPNDILKNVGGISTAIDGLNVLRDKVSNNSKLSAKVRGRSNGIGRYENPDRLPQVEAESE